MTRLVELVSRRPGWAFGLALALICAGTAAVVWLVAGRGGGELALFEERSTDYALTFAESVSSWIQAGDLEMVESASRFLLLGSALFVRVYWDGELVVDERVGDIVVPDSGGPGYLTLPSGQRCFHVKVPIPSRGDARGWVSLGLDSTWIAARARGRLIVGAAVGAAVDMLLGGALALLARRLRPRKGRLGARPEFTLGGLEVFDRGKQVRLFGKPVPLSPKQFALLRLLISSPGRVFSDQEILEAVWPDSRYANSKDVKQYIYLLRRKLGAVHPGAESMIVTVPGFGYKLIPPDEAGLT